MAKTKADTNGGRRNSSQISQGTPLALGGTVDIPKTQPDYLRASPAQNPPAEILSEIFLHNIPTHYISSTEVETASEWQAFFNAVSPINVACVSRSWRHVALGTRTLWSTWFLELNAPSAEALSMLKCFLKRFTSRSGNCLLKPHVRFLEISDTSRICDAVDPLLQCQERWEDVEICLGTANINGDVPIPTLDFSKLSSLHGLTAHGTAWYCGGADFAYIFHLKLPLPLNLPRLSSLQTAKLIDLPLLAYFPILFAAPNLTELVIHIDDGLDNLLAVSPRTAFLPCLRKLELRKTSLRLPHVSLLQFLKFEALEELSVNSSALPHFRLLLSFRIPEDSNLGNTLLTLRYFKDEGTDATQIFDLLGKLHSLRSLEVHNEPSALLIAMLADVRDDTAHPRLCPLLERLVLEGASGRGYQYPQLIKARWNAPDRSIRAMSFIDCEFTWVMDLFPEDLIDIPEADAFIEEGLELDIQTTL